MPEKQNQKKKVLILILVLGLVLLTVGGTYAFFTYSRQGEKLNTLTTGTMYFVYDELPNQDGNQISISNAFPIMDVDGKNQEQPGMFEFQVRATTQGAPIYYEVYLTNESDSLELEALPEKIVKTYLTDTSSGDETSITNHWTSQDVNFFNELWVSQVPPVKENLNGRTLLQDEVQDNVQDYVKTYRYRMWIGDNANKVNKDGEWAYSNRAFSVHVNVYASNEKLPDPIPPRATFIATSQDDSWFNPTDVEVTTKQVTSISFVKQSEVPSETITNWDITANPDDPGRVTAYLVKNKPLEEEETYSVYISSNSKTIYLNENSSYLFSNFEKLGEINGLEALDTSNVTDMSSMFAYCGQLSDLNSIENWDTSSVTSMSDMFLKCEQLVELNVADWNTSHLESSSAMFKGCTLTSIDLSGWDTSKLIEMGSPSAEDQFNSPWSGGMFEDCENLVTIKGFDNFNLDKIITIHNLFRGCKKLNTSITIRSNIERKEYIDMAYKAFTETGSQLVINYIDDVTMNIAQAIVDYSNNENVILGSKVQ